MKLTDKQGIILGSIAAFICAIIFGFVIYYNPDIIKLNTKQAQIQEEKPKEIVYNNPLDASVYQVEKYLKENLNDPYSYESIEWSEVKKLDDKFIVRHKYRAKNGFGALVIQNQIFTLNASGDVVSTIDYK